MAARPRKAGSGDVSLWERAEDRAVGAGAVAVRPP